MKTLKVLKKRESIRETMTLPVTKSQLERYRLLAGELDNRGLTKLNDMTRERLDQLLNEVEEELAKSS